jgi:hypothetical protein
LETAVAAMRGLLNFAEEKGYVDLIALLDYVLKARGSLLGNVCHLLKSN